MKMVLEITISQDDDQWYALVGPDLQGGVVGSADTIKNALTELALTLTQSDISRFMTHYKEEH